MIKSISVILTWEENYGRTEEYVVQVFHVESLGRSDNVVDADSRPRSLPNLMELRSA